MRAYSPTTAAIFAARGPLMAHVLVWISARNRESGAVESIGFWTGVDHLDFQIGAETRTYYGAGDLIGLEPVRWRTGLQVQTQQLRLSQVSPEAQLAIRGYDTRHAPVEIHRALFDPAGGQLLDAPHLVLGGFVDRINLTTPEKGGRGEIRLDIATRARALTRPLNRYRSHASLTARAAEDTFRKWASTAAKTEVKWGSK